MPKEGQRITEVPFHGHDVDGISFVTRRDGSILGAGWQGRSFLFKPGQEALLISAVQKLRNGQSQLEQKYEISVKTEDDQLNLDVSQKQGWVEARDKEQNVGFAIATADREAITHILGELKTLFAGSDTHATHFCEQYGVEDDD